MKLWASTQVAAGQGVTMAAMAADGARLLERDDREVLWLVLEDMQRRLSQPPLDVAAKYTKNQVRDSIWCEVCAESAVLCCVVLKVESIQFVIENAARLQHFR